MSGAKHRKSGGRMRAIVAGLAVTALALPLLASTATNASWRDGEFAFSTLGTLDCLSPAELESRASGRLITGSLLGSSLDPILELRGILADNDGFASLPTPAATPEITPGSDAYAKAIDLALISSLIQLQLGLPLPLDFGVGVYNQYARAQDTGIATGASGVVNDSGAVDLDTIQDPGTPSMGTFRLSDLPGLAPVLSGITDLELEIGAVAASATADGCADAWYGTDSITRNYAIAGLDLDIASPLVTTLATTSSTLVSGLGTNLDGLVATTEGVLKGVVETTVGGILNDLLTVGNLGATTATVEIDLNLISVTTLLTQPITDGAVTVDLSTGRIGVDLEALVGQVYADSDGLNGRAPNTQVLSAAVINALLTRVDTLITSLVSDIDEALTKALNDATVKIHVDAGVSALGLNVIDINADISATVGGLTNVVGYSPATVTASAVLLPGVSTNPVLSLLLSAINGLVASLTTNLVPNITSTLLPALTTPLMSNLVTPALTNIATTVSQLNSAVQTLVTALDPVLALLSQLVSITLNSQPDVAPHPASPYASAGAGEFFVSALRVGVADGTGGGANSLLNLFLASASSGPNGPVG